MRSVFLFIFISSFFLSCKKGNSEVNLLTYKTWKHSTTDKNPSNNPSPGNAIYIPFWDCEMNDVYTFNDTKLTINRGDDNCNVNGPALNVCDYSIDLPNQRITINGDSYKLIELSENQLKYYFSTYDFTTTPATINNYIFLYEH